MLFSFSFFDSVAVSSFHLVIFVLDRFQAHAISVYVFHIVTFCRVLFCYAGPWRNFSWRPRGHMFKSWKLPLLLRVKTVYTWAYEKVSFWKQMYQTSISGENFVYVNRMSLMQGASSFCCFSVHLLMFCFFSCIICMVVAFQPFC